MRNRSSKKMISIEPLTEIGYAKTFVSFDAASTGGFEAKRLAHPIIKSFNGKQIDLMSIGAGTGCLEDDLVKNFGLNLQSFLAIEPNPKHAEQLRETAGSWENVDVTVDQKPFDEDYETEKRFDMILMVHCMYCVENPFKVIIKARSFLKPEGTLMIVNQAHQGFDEIGAEMRKAYSFTCRPISDQSVTIESLSKALEDNGIKHETTIAPSRLDITDFINKSDSPTANDVVSFMLQTDYENLDEDLRERIYQMVKERIVTDKEGRHLYPHPTGMIACTL